MRIRRCKGFFFGNPKEEEGRRVGCFGFRFDGFWKEGICCLKIAYYKVYTYSRRYGGEVWNAFLPVDGWLLTTNWRLAVLQCRCWTWKVRNRLPASANACLSAFYCFIVFVFFLLGLFSLWKLLAHFFSRGFFFMWTLVGVWEGFCPNPSFWIWRT